MALIQMLFGIALLFWLGACAIAWGIIGICKIRFTLKPYINPQSQESQEVTQ